MGYPAMVAGRRVRARRSWIRFILYWWIVLFGWRVGGFILFRFGLLCL